MQDVAYLRRVAFLGALGSIGLSLWSAYELVQLEQHRVASAGVHWLIALLYENMGFWPAVLAFPMLGVVAVSSIARRIARLRSQHASR